MKERDSVIVSFRCPKEVVMRFDRLLKTHNLNRQNVLREFVSNFDEQEANMFEISADKLGNLEQSLKEKAWEIELLQQDIERMKKGLSTKAKASDGGRASKGKPSSALRKGE